MKENNYFMQLENVKSEGGLKMWNLDKARKGDVYGFNVLKINKRGKNEKIFFNFVKLLKPKE